MAKLSADTYESIIYALFGVCSFLVSIIVFFAARAFKRNENHEGKTEDHGTRILTLEVTCKSNHKGEK